MPAGRLAAGRLPPPADAYIDQLLAGSRPLVVDRGLLHAFDPDFPAESGGDSLGLLRIDGTETLPDPVQFARFIDGGGFLGHGQTRM